MSPIRFGGCYNRKEGRPGKWTRDQDPDAYACCKAVPAQCRTCPSCLIKVGPLHHQKEMGRTHLPYKIDRFIVDEASRPAFERLVQWSEKDVCTQCVARLEAPEEESLLTRWLHTLIIREHSPKKRRGFVNRYCERTRQPLPTRRNTGGFTRVPDAGGPA